MIVDSSFLIITNAVRQITTSSNGKRLQIHNDRSTLGQNGGMKVILLRRKILMMIPQKIY